MKKIDSACANTIINCFFGTRESLTHLKIQKILYYSMGHCLASNNLRIVEENFQAWPHGPVLPNLYYSLKKYDDGEIAELIECEDGKCYKYTEGETFEGIKYVTERLKHFSAWELVDKSHDINGPWFETVKTKGYKVDIDTNTIKEYFKKFPIDTLMA